MEISGISSPTVSQVSRQKAGDAVGVSVLDKALDVEVAAAAELINSVASPPQDVPGEKLPPHLGRNINVSA